MHLRTFTAVIAALAAATTISTAPLDNRIVHGTPAAEDEFPMFASFRGCGGALIGPQIILTGI